MATITELQENRQALITQAKLLVTASNTSAEKVAEAKRMYQDVQRIGEQIAVLNGLQEQAGVIEAAQELKMRGAQPSTGSFKNRAEFLTAVVTAGSSKRRFYADPRLTDFRDSGEPETKAFGNPGEVAWESKALAEGTGASGGFLVPTEFYNDVMAVDPVTQPIRMRANVIPMTRRELRIPVLNQTGTTVGQPSWFGGLIAYWEAEAAEKTESSPTFRQASLVAHKLICYTRASDELLNDAIISLDAWLQSDMGFAGAIRWYSEYAFLRGTGAGQPQGVITAVNSPTIVQPAAGAGLAVADITGMLEHHFGPDPVWHISRSQMSNLLQLNGPAGNPSYIFIPNGRDGAPATLMGYPIIWEDKLPAAGQQGAVLLASWRYYVIGDRQAVTFRSTDIERFQYDQTSFRAVARLDGMPWMSAPITYSDGTTQVSPFVILGATGS